ncbi:MAG: 3-deoxy-D-manno-octulosonic acid kinase [Motiliproteus sp.]|jgi:3-deoxy-D-manno-octulosonic acid kinase
MNFQIIEQDPATLLVAPELAGHITPSWFDLNWWRSRGGPIDSAPGRGESYFLQYGELALELVWRHYKRGGLIAKASEDRYLWTGLQQTRAYQEFVLTAELRARGLPVPRPLAAQVIREGLSYRADFITERLPGVQSMADRLDANLHAFPWVEVGHCIARFHAQGLDHVDLNIRNILLDGDDRVFVIDFDRCRLRPPKPSWQQSNLDRLLRSIHKLLPQQDHDPHWQRLLAGYKAG